MTAQAGAMAAQFGRGEVASGLVSVISVALLVIPAVGICYVLMLSGRTAFRAAAAAARKHPALRAPLAVAAITAAAGLAASWGLLRGYPGRPPRSHRPPLASVSPSPALVAIPAASSVKPPWPTQVLDRQTGQPPRPARGFRPAATTARTARAALKAKPKAGSAISQPEASSAAFGGSGGVLPSDVCAVQVTCAVELTRAVQVS